MQHPERYRLTAKYTRQIGYHVKLSTHFLSGTPDMTRVEQENAAKSCTFHCRKRAEKHAARLRMPYLRAMLAQGMSSHIAHQLLDMAIQVERNDLRVTRRC